MKIKEFIEAAIEGGWENNAFSDNPHNAEFIEEIMFLDPEAWKTVGKVKGWETHDSTECWEYVNEFDQVVLLDMWENKMHDMIDALCNGKTLEEYIATL